MPTFMTTAEEFLKEMREAQTPFTRRMNELFAQPGGLKKEFPKEYETLRAPGGLDRLSAGLKDLLMQIDEEYTAIRSWPAEQKEQLRLKLVDAIDQNRTVHFSWELYRGEHEITEIVDPGPGRGISITFRSPWKKLRWEGGNFIQQV